MLDAYPEGTQRAGHTVGATCLFDLQNISEMHDKALKLELVSQ